LLATVGARAQAVPDTSLNTPVPDSLGLRQRAALAAGDGPKQTLDSLTPAPFRPKPKRAALWSSLVPGAGQIYNRQYWKSPIVWVGMGASFYFLEENSRELRRYRQALVYINDGDPTTVSEFEGLRTPQDLVTLRDYYRRNLDITMLLTAVGYTIQVLDALVYAHLRGFDVSQDISLRIQPSVQPGLGAGLGLAVRLK